MKKFKVKVVPLYETRGGLTADPGPTYSVVSANSLEEAMHKAGRRCEPILAADRQKPVVLNVTVEVPQ